MLPVPGPHSVEELLAQSSWLRRLAATLVAGEEAAEDLVQETWLAALRHPPRSGGSPRPWLARIARNLASNFRRGEARRAEREARVPERGPEQDPGSAVEEVEAQRVLAEAVLRLEEPLRTAVVLRYVRGLDSREIGRLQGIPATTVRGHLKRALEILRADLDQRFGERSRWCSAFGVLLRDGAGGSLTASAPLASSSVIAVAALLAAVSLLALSGARWLTSWDHPRGADPVRTELQTARVLGEDSELFAPREVDEPTGSGAGSRLRSLPDTGAPAGDGTRRRSRIHGQLRMDESGEVLDEALTVRLRMGDLSVKDTLVSAADGSFTSKKAFPRGNVLADVRRPAGDTAVDYEAYFDPSSDEAWVVSVPWPNFVRGRLVDGKGQPLASERGASDVEVRVFQDDADIEAIREEMTPKRSPDGGTFWFSGLNLGRCTVTVLRGFERHDFSTPVRRGPNELGDVVVPFRERVGPIHGRLTGPEHGGWGTLRLVEVATGITYETQARPDSSEFEFETVPRGNYRLTLYPRDGLRYAKPTRFLSPPATNIEFVAIGESDPVRFRPIDKESGQEIPLWNAWVLSSGRWCEVTACADAQKRHGNLEVTLEPSDIERWILAADGYRPAMGGAPDSARVDARLESGWGGAMFFVEGWGLLVKEQGRPLSGVEVLADGLPVALSDQDGAALLSLPRRPGLIEWDLPGWRRANAPEDAFSGSPLTMVRE